MNEKENPVFCLNCNKTMFTVFVTESKIIMKCYACDWKMVIPVGEIKVQ